MLTHLALVIPRLPDTWQLLITWCIYPILGKLWCCSLLNLLQVAAYRWCFMWCDRRKTRQWSDQLLWRAWASASHFVSHNIRCDEKQPAKISVSWESSVNRNNETPWMICLLCVLPGSSKGHIRHFLHLKLMNLLNKQANKKKCTCENPKPLQKTVCESISIRLPLIQLSPLRGY